MNRLVFVFMMCGLAAGLAAQQPDRSDFEVASIKVSRSGLPGPVWTGTGPGRFVVDGITAANLIRNAYDLRPEEIVGGPAWLDAERFQVNATYPAQAPTPQVNGMLRSLLADRFALKVHRDRRDVQKYRLVLANANGRLGPQLRTSTAQCSSPHPDRPCSMRFGGNELMMQETTIRQLLNFLESIAERRIEDQTGLQGEYDLTLTWSRGTNDVERPVFFTALQEQLGFKLEQIQGPVDVLVIDSVQRPSPD